jgi:hypothetical protein
MNDSKNCLLYVCIKCSKRMALVVNYGRFMCELRSSLVRPFLSSRAVTFRSLSSKVKRNLSSSNKNNNDAQYKGTSVYVHPLSRVLLQYFQSDCHEWICSKHLDRNLTLQRDGTFVLQQVRRDSVELPKTIKSPRIWT